MKNFIRDDRKATYDGGLYFFATDRESTRESKMEEYRHNLMKNTMTAND